MNGADAVLRSLEAEGVEVMFGLPGGAILPLYDAMARGTTVRHVLARHEQGAGHMAEGYARASGRVGVAVATSGPGATNLVTPIADAWMDSTPLVCITGQVKSFLIGTDAFQECDITGITIPIVKHSWLVQDVSEIPHIMKAAFHVASTGRCGPVLVDIPRDVQEAETEFVYPDEVNLPGWKPPRRGHPRQIKAAAQAIAEAERPILYVGGGVLNAHATDEVLALAEAGNLPVVTTLMAKSGFPESHDLHVGWPGMHGPKWSNWALNKADVVVAVGARFDDRVTGKLSAFAPGATIVHLDIDAAEISKIRHADIPVVGPLKPVLAELTKLFADEALPGRTDAWLQQIAEWREQFPLRYSAEAGPMLKPQKVLQMLQSLTAGRDDIVWTTGVGQHQMWAMQYVLCDHPRTFITSGGLGTMGYGLPAAVGAKAARPDATVICVDGDGCFQMTCQELATAALEDLPIVVVIVNNGYLGMVRQWQDMFFEERFSQVNLTHSLPDYEALARAYGALGFTAENEEELEEALTTAIASPGSSSLTRSTLTSLCICFSICSSECCSQSTRNVMRETSWRSVSPTARLSML
jgi:acetolactate synthase-1/2/3 large subunit